MTTTDAARLGGGFAALRDALWAAVRAAVLAAFGTAHAQSPAPAASAPSLAPAADATPCAPVPAGAQRLAAGGVQAWWLPEPGPLRVGQGFALRVTLCPTQARLLRVDAQMPEHRHGMNYRPSVQPLGDGQWRAEGLLWHMPGRWELLLETRLGDQPQRLTQSVQLR